MDIYVAVAHTRVTEALKASKLDALSGILYNCLRWPLMFISSDNNQEIDIPYLS
jgi:hypothetical protein